jgi:hypothetical protein
MRLPALLSALAVASSLTASARADLPPPDDERNVGYSFSVRGLSAAPDRVLLSYPCGSSNGAPSRELAVIEEGRPVQVGRRGGDCPLYAMARAEYEEWAKTYVQKGEMENAEADALIAKATKCAGAPTPTFTVSKDDARESLSETLEVKKLSATECVVASTGVPTASATAPRGSCGRSCAAVTRGDRAWSLGAIAVATFAAAALRRRRRAP